MTLNDNQSFFSAWIWNWYCATRSISSSDRLNSFSYSSTWIEGMDLVAKRSMRSLYVIMCSSLISSVLSSLHSTSLNSSWLVLITKDFLTFLDNCLVFPFIWNTSLSIWSYRNRMCLYSTKKKKMVDKKKKTEILIKSTLKMGQNSAIIALYISNVWSDWRKKQREIVYILILIVLILILCRYREEKKLAERVKYQL